MPLSRKERDFYDEREAFVSKFDSICLNHGIDPTGQRALLSIESRLKELEQLQQEAQRLGYKSVSTALYGLSKQRKYSNIPDDLTVAPQHWIVERRITTETYWKDGNRKERTRTLPAVNAVTAQRQLDHLQPVIDELLEDAAPRYINDLRQALLSMSYEAFSAELLRHLAEDRGQQQTFDVEPADTLPQIAERTQEETEILMARLQGRSVTQH